MGAVEVAVLIPVKRFSAAKGRLGGLLGAAERAELARWLADRVVLAARPLPTFVACDDEDVASWADAAGAGVLWSPGLGLNGAVDAGRATIAGKGFDHIVIAHSDLPLAHALGAVAVEATVTLVPDRRSRRHERARPAGRRRPRRPPTAPARSTATSRAAVAGGHRVEVRGDPRLALDVDNPDDLTHPALLPHLPTWLRTSLDNRH